MYLKDLERFWNWILPCPFCWSTCTVWTEKNKIQTNPILRWYLVIWWNLGFGLHCKIVMSRAKLPMGKSLFGTNLALLDTFHCFERKNWAVKKCRAIFSGLNWILNSIRKRKLRENKINWYCPIFCDLFIPREPRTCKIVGLLKKRSLFMKKYRCLFKKK